MKKTVEEIAETDGRYNVNALKFVHDGLGHTIQETKGLQAAEDVKSRHISGAELAKGLAQLAQKRWGRLAKVVLNHWNINVTRDFGEIVFLMIENGWMSACDSDRIEDFDNVYDLEQILEKQFEFENN